MRTSGAGSGDSMMTIVPLAMLALLLVWMAGGPQESLAWLENILRGLTNWVAELVR